MAILKIARMGHPILRRPAEAVDDPTAPEIGRLVADMIDTIADAPGIGLAAPQVHVSRRVVVFHVPRSRAGDPDAEEGDGDGPVPLTVVINPVIEPLADDTAVDWEGCLSVPGLIGAVPRFKRIRYRGLTPAGGRVERIGEGFHARIVQHECDHLDGILYPQRMADLALLGFVSEIDRYRPPVSEEA